MPEDDEEGLAPDQLENYDQFEDEIGQLFDEQRAQFKLSSDTRMGEVMHRVNVNESLRGIGNFAFRGFGAALFELTAGMVKALPDNQRRPR